eukprot:526165-Prymnesium_polylepis.2
MWLCALRGAGRAVRSCLCHEYPRGVGRRHRGDVAEGGVGHRLSRDVLPSEGRRGAAAKFQGRGGSAHHQHGGAGRRYGRDRSQGRRGKPRGLQPLSSMSHRDEHASKTPNRGTHIYTQHINHHADCCVQPRSVDVLPNTRPK